VEKGELGKGVRRMVLKQLERSALIAWDARPRDLRPELEESAGTRPSTAENNPTRIQRKHKSSHNDTTVIPISIDAPPWGHIAHPGWSSPASADLPNLQFWQVVLELPNLIEAKAVSLAPADSAFDAYEAEAAGKSAIPDARIVAILQRPAATGLREYLTHLSLIGLINPPTLGPRFLNHYERARFSNTSITERAFRELMAIFSDILAGMTQLKPEHLEKVGFTDFESGSSFVSGSTTSSNGSVRRHSMRRVESIASSSQESLATVMHSVT